MTLRDMILEYRTAHHLSQRQFALSCGLSNGYIAMLERGKNPNTGEPITPSLVALKKLADGMGMSLSELFSSVDDVPLKLPAEKAPIPASGDERTREFVSMFEQLSDTEQALVIAQIKGILASRGWHPEQPPEA